jgi:hypothetical protein
MDASGRAWLNGPTGSALVGVFPEPLHGCRAGVEDRDVPVIRTQPQFCRGAAAREPLAVRAGHDSIPATVQEEDRRDYPRGFENTEGSPKIGRSGDAPSPLSLYASLVIWGGAGIVRSGSACPTTPKAKTLGRGW